MRSFWDFRDRVAKFIFLARQGVRLMSLGSAILNAIVLPLTFLGVYGVKFGTVGIIIYGCVIVFLFVFAGFIYTWTGIFRKEIDFNNEHNEMLKSIDKKT